MQNDYQDRPHKEASRISSHYRQDRLNEAIERQTKKIPNAGFLALALGSIAASAVLTFGMKRRDLGNFVGLWVPTLLLFGVYNKIVKLEDETLEQVVMH